jgi:hypothetical protein
MDEAVQGYVDGIPKEQKPLFDRLQLLTSRESRRSSERSPRA